MLRALWLVAAYKHIDDVTENVTVFFLVFNMARGFENVCKIFPDYASKGHENSLAGAFYQKEKRRNREKESSWPLENV